MPTDTTKEREVGGVELVLKGIAQIRDILLNKDSTYVENIDEVTATLRNELPRAVSPIVAAVKGIKLPAPQEVRPQFDIKLPAEVKIPDFPPINIPEQKDEISVKNLNDLSIYFDNLENVIQSTFNVPAPQVNVSPPEVTVKPADVNIDPVDLKPLLDALKPLKFITNKSGKPISVRLSDGKNFLKAVQKIQDSNDKVVQAFSSGLTEKGVRDAFKGAINATTGAKIAGEGRKALSNAGAGVQLSATSVSCAYVDITADSTRISVGATTSTQMTSPTGAIIAPNDTPYRVYTDNLNKVYVSAGSGAACYAYYV